MRALFDPLSVILIVLIVPAVCVFTQQGQDHRYLCQQHNKKVGISTYFVGGQGKPGVGLTYI